MTVWLPLLRLRQRVAVKNNMQKISLKTFLLLLTALFILSSCINIPGITGPDGGKGEILENNGEIRLTPDKDKIAIFVDRDPDGFFARNDRGNGFPFGCSFMRSNAVVANNKLTMTLDKQGDQIVGAEYRTWMRYSYGYYSVSMKAAACSGVISSFFIYTGRPWDEIDIEFLGDDTTKVQFNYYTSGAGGHEFVYDLGFDASKDFHEYGFDWQEDSITWYVDGVAVYRATESIPSHPGNIMMNIWNVADAYSSWAGRFDEKDLPTSAEYQWIGYHSAEDGADI